MPPCSCRFIRPAAARTESKTHLRRRVAHLKGELNRCFRFALFHDQWSIKHYSCVAMQEVLRYQSSGPNKRARFALRIFPVGHQLGQGRERVERLQVGARVVFTIRTVKQVSHGVHTEICFEFLRSFVPARFLIDMKGAVPNKRLS